MTKFLARERVVGSGRINEAIADQTINAADTYVTGSNVDLGALDARTSLRLRLWLTKTAAGIAQPTLKVRIGTHAAIADVAELSFQLPAQTAAADTAYVEILALFRAGGATAVLEGVCRLMHNLATTGFATSGTPVVEATSSAFDASSEALHAGLSIDPGASGVWTVKGCIAEVITT